MTGQRIEYDTKYISFSGADAVASAVFPEAGPIYMGRLRGISYSILRVVIAVPTLGKVRVSGFARGLRVVAGTLIFTASWNQHWSRDLMNSVPYLKGLSHLKPDEFPPFDIVVTVANEYGASGGYVIQGVRIVDEGEVISEEDTLTENVVSFQAVDFFPLEVIEATRDVGNVSFQSVFPFRIDELLMFGR
jgi:hypothetical protein